MNIDDLFLLTLEDLEQRTTPGASEYDVLMSAGLMRKLVLDAGQSLVDQVNRTRRLKLTFWINQPDDAERMIRSLGAVTWGLTGGLDPDTSPSQHTAAHVNRDQFLARTIIVNEGTNYSVADVIRTTANVIGGTHAGPWKDVRLTSLGELDSQLSVGGVGGAVRALPAVARVLARGVDPLAMRVRHERGLS